jgi:hypothetical protein
MPATPNKTSVIWLQHSCHRQETAESGNEADLSVEEPVKDIRLLGISEF